METSEREPVILGIDVGGLEADIVAVDVLARLALVARRHGCEIVLRYASQELRDLIELAGLSEVLPR